MRYSPFEKSLQDITGDDLSVLSSTAEGWYVEYKSEPIGPKAFAKSLSALANHYGGWLFIGIEERDRFAASFPGIALSEVAKVEEQLRNATKDCVSPPVLFEHRIIAGHVPSIGLAADRAVIVVRVPLGLDAPYVHRDGRIYRRVADASDPKLETDRAVLDLLWKRGRDSRKALKKLVEWSPKVSKGEEGTPYLHLFLSHDPLGQSGRRYGLKFERFAEIMQHGDLTFDNVYAHSGGLTARQVANNDAYNRCFTWEYSFQGHSRVTLPFSGASGKLEQFFGTYKYFDRFYATFERQPRSVEPLVVDLNILFRAIGYICHKHRLLLSEHGEEGPFFAKARLENIWRRAPYLDTEAFVKFVERFGVPVVQAASALAPSGTSPQSLVALNRGPATESIAQWVQDSSGITMFIFAALGLPLHVLSDSQSELAYLLGRALDAQKSRNERSKLRSKDFED